MLLWPRYEQRLFQTDVELARSWTDRVQQLGFVLDDSDKWARIGNTSQQYHWAAVVGRRATLRVYLVDTRFAKLVGPLHSFADGLYFVTVFRVTDTNIALANAVEHALFGENAQCVGRSIRHLGGKPRLIT